MHTPRLTLRRLAFLVAAAYAPTVFAAPAARVEFSTSEPIIVGADGRERPARKGEQIVPGDRIQTRAGRAQLAFTDGSFVSLQPNTDFGVSEYNFKGSNDGSEKSVMSLLKGALRTVTGLIGRSKRDAYLMTTPTATIGIRGTGGRIEVNERGTLVAGTSGTWFMSTPGGTIDIPAGSAGFAGPNPNQPPQPASGGPATPPAGTSGAGQPVYVAADQVGSTGTSNVAPPAPPVASSGMVDGPGYGVGYVFDSNSPAAVSNSTATFSGGKTLTTFTDSSYTQSLGTMQVVDYGNDGTVGWGRWTNGTATINGSPVALSANQGLHYVVGVPTATMPNTGTASYSMVGATKPTDISGSYAPGTLVSAYMNVDWVSSSITGLGLTVLLDGKTFAVTKSGGGSITGNTALAMTLYGTGGGCGGCNCGGYANAAFYGASARYGGIVFQITGGGYTINGAAVVGP